MGERSPRFVKPQSFSPSSPFGRMMNQMARCTSAGALRKLHGDVIMMDGKVTPEQMQRLETAWSQRYEAVCKEYGAHS